MENEQNVTIRSSILTCTFELMQTENVGDVRALKGGLYRWCLLGCYE
jgi:hypothetical protein